MQKRCHCMGQYSAFTRPFSVSLFLSLGDILTNHIHLMCSSLAPFTSRRSEYINMTEMTFSVQTLRENEKAK